MKTHLVLGRSIWSPIKRFSSSSCTQSLACVSSRCIQGLPCTDFVKQDNFCPFRGSGVDTCNFIADRQLVATFSWSLSIIRSTRDPATPRKKDHFQKRRPASSPSLSPSNSSSIRAPSRTRDRANGSSTVFNFSTNFCPHRWSSFLSDTLREKRSVNLSRKLTEFTSPLPLLVGVLYIPSGYSRVSPRL